MLIKNPSRVRISNFLWYYGTLTLFDAVSILSRPVRVQGRENLHKIKQEHHSKGVIIVVNHVSYSDSWIVASLCRPYLPTIRFMAACDLTDYALQKTIHTDKLKVRGTPPLLASLMASIFARLMQLTIRYSATILVDRQQTLSLTNVKAVKESFKVLGSGGTVGVFPQGGIDGTKIHDGALKLSLASHSAILPIELIREPASNTNKKSWFVTIKEPWSHERLQRYTQKHGVDSEKLFYEFFGQSHPISKKTDG